MVARESPRVTLMNEFELFFDENKNEWCVKYMLESPPFTMKTTIRFLINPPEDEKIFWNATLYQRMLRWLKKEHEEFFV